MPQFQYRAFDNSGATTEGDINASTAHEAVRQLVQRGLKVQSIQALSSTVEQPPPVAPIQPVSTVSPTPIARPPHRQETQSSPVLLPPSAKRLPNQPIRTKPSSYTELFFLFSQLARLLQSGISTSKALHELAQRQQQPERQNALRKMAEYCGEGGSLADAMENYPDLFPPGVVGAVRSGEAGGYVWQACESVADQQQKSAGIRKVYWWVGALVMSAIFIFPLTLAVGQGLDRSFATMSGLPGLVKGFGTAMISSAAGWTFWLMVAACFVGKRLLSTTSSRGFRHRIGFNTPILGKRARQENLSYFTWHLGQLSKAGLSPMSSWELASTAVPNLEYSKILLEQGKSIHESTRLSQLLFGSKLVPQEYSGLIETGEMTGSLPQALDQAADLSRADVAATEQFLKWKMGCWGLLVMVGVSAIAYALFARGYIDSLFKNILEDF